MHTYIHTYIHMIRYKWLAVSFSGLIWCVYDWILIFYALPASTRFGIEWVGSGLSPSAYSVRDLKPCTTAAFRSCSADRRRAPQRTPVLGPAATWPSRRRAVAPTIPLILSTSTGRCTRILIACVLLLLHPLLQAQPQPGVKSSRCFAVMHLPAKLKASFYVGLY